MQQVEVHFNDGWVSHFIMAFIPRTGEYMRVNPGPYEDADAYHYYPVTRVEYWIDDQTDRYTSPVVFLGPELALPLP